MRKSIILKVKLKVEGDAAPADDFAQIAMQAVKDILAAGRLRHPLLKVTVKESGEDTNDGDDAGRAGQAAPGK